MFKNRIVRHFVNILGIISLGMLFFYLSLFLRDFFLSNVVPVNENIPTEVWQNEIFTLGLYDMLAAIFFIALLWYVFEQWIIFRPYSSRLRWFLLLIIQFIITISLSIVLFIRSPLQSDNWKPFIVYIGIGFLNFYLATLLFSPSSVKYSAPLSKFIRCWW